MIQKLILFIAALGLVFGLTVRPTVAHAKESKRVYFIYPKDGAKIPATFKAKFNVKGMKLVPAGVAPDDKTSGHLHLIIDAPAAAEGVVIPADATHLHYGKGQTESANITLPPGKHTLTLQLADGLHRGYGPDLVKTITVTVK